MRIEHASRDWLIEPLAAHHNRTAFRCGNESLDRYLKHHAGQEARRRVAAPFVLTQEADRGVVAGYYTLSAFAIDLGDLPAGLANKLPHYPLVPATLLGRLAIDRDYQGHGLGELLVMDALHRGLTQSAVIASAIIVVDAIDEAAWRFYRHFEFGAFPENRRRLFLAMETVAKLFI